MEDKISNFNNSLDFIIPHSVHPEKLIRIFRRHIFDIPFIHLLRILFHREKTMILLNSDTSFYPRENQFHYFLWNYYIYEFEYSLLSVWKQIYWFHSSLFWFSFDRISFVQKIGNISKQLDFVDRSFAQKCNSIHYVRYRNNSIINVGTNTELPIDFWRVFFNILWEKYFHSWLKPDRVSIINLYKNALSLLGYTIHTEKKSVTIRIQLVNYSIDTNSITEQFCGIIPTLPLIELLAKENFCDISGRPICKLPWTTLADNEIFGRFDRIVKNIFCYYSGCFKKKGLYQLQYVLRFSCAKTLACKHKSTIRTVWKKYGSNFATNFVFSREIKLNSSNSWQMDSREKKFWYLNILQTNYLSNFLQKLKIRNSER
uniref:maturase K n=1 Tax=Pallavicinia lyellii TaxID=56939 RepID=UPI001D113084|nr:maturase K [Pallavicinia lyellii]QZZ24677.1 maturase K [Pallavicinia lyellii]QZZ24761.1 maturase K [Pallavicinia lyellii]